MDNVDHREVSDHPVRVPLDPQLSMESRAYGWLICCDRQEPKDTGIDTWEDGSMSNRDNGVLFTLMAAGPLGRERVHLEGKAQPCLAPAGTGNDDGRR